LKGLLEKSGVGKEIKLTEEEVPQLTLPVGADGSKNAVAGTTAGARADDPSIDPRSKDRSPKRKSIPDVASRSASTLLGGNRHVAFTPAERDVEDTGA
jgi:hypothetical protein